MNSIQTTAIQKVYRSPILNKVSKKLIVTNMTGHHFIDPDSILYLKSDGNYCHIYLTDSTRIFCSRTLKSIYNELDSNQFIRSHNSIVINWKMIVYINTPFTEIKMNNGVILPVSRSKKKAIKMKMSDYKSIEIRPLRKLN